MRQKWLGLAGNAIAGQYLIKPLPAFLINIIKFEVQQPDSAIIQSKKFRTLSKEPIEKLLCKAQNGDIAARNEIIKRNFWIIVKISSHTRSDIRNEVLGELFVTAINSVKNYRAVDGASFENYLAECLRRRARRRRSYWRAWYASHGMLGCDALQRYIRIKRTHNKLFDQAGSPPTTEAVGKLAGVTSQLVCQAMAFSSVSLENPDANFSEILPDRQGVRDDTTRDIRQIINRALRTLDKKTEK